MKPQNKQRQNWTRRVLLILAGICFLLPLPVYAQEGMLNYNVTPVFPQSQNDDNKSYFDLRLDPGGKETISLKLQNVRQEPIELAVTVHTAFTNVMGVVEYGENAEEKDPTLTHTLSELIEGPDTVSLAANETKTVAFDLQMPIEKFEGFLAGGLRVSEIKEETEQSSEGEGAAIINEFSYVVALLISNSRDSISPDLELLDVFPDQLNARNVISANLQNFQPAFLNQLAVEATIQRVGEEEILYEASQEMMQMAPNSNFNFPISLEGEPFKSGDYVLHLKATSGSQEWTWEREFTIDADEAKALNRTDVTLDSSINWWMVGTILLCVILIGVIFYILLSNRQHLIERK